MSQFAAGRWTSNGQQIVTGWNNSGTTVAFTGLVGTDSKYFLPVDDRGGYSPGQLVNLPTGGVYFEGYPSVNITHAWISDGQIETMKTYQGNCTLKHHLPESVGSTDLQASNVIYVMDLNQLDSLTRVGDGYENFVSRFIIVGLAS